LPILGGLLGEQHELLQVLPQQIEVVVFLPVALPAVLLIYPID
jgi:hypothetical protein